MHIFNFGRLDIKFMNKNMLRRQHGTNVKSKPVSSEGDISRKFLATPLTVSRDSFSPPVLLSQLTKNSKSELLCLDGRDSM